MSVAEPERLATVTAVRPTVSVVVACTEPSRIRAIAEALATGTANACELVVAGDVRGLPDDGWPVPTTLIPCDDPHPNLRRSLAVAASTAPIVAFLDDDAVPRPGWLDVACSMAVDTREVWTGPEEPTRTTAGARFAAEVAASVVAEGTRAHVHLRHRTVRWFEAPFCNLVTSRSFLDEVGMPATDIAWDLDDFVWCRRAAGRGAVFRNRPDLRIGHDRYPDGFAGWLRRKAVERRRTGHKLVLYPDLYLRIPAVVLAAAAPVVAVATLGAPAPTRRRIRATATVAYAMTLTVESHRAGRRGVAAIRFAAGLVGLHVVSVGAMATGVAHGLWNQARRRAADPHAPVPPATTAERR